MKHFSYKFISVLLFVLLIAGELFAHTAYYDNAAPICSGCPTWIGSVPHPDTQEEVIDQCQVHPRRSVSIKCSAFKDAQGNLWSHHYYSCLSGGSNCYGAGCIGCVMTPFNALSCTSNANCLFAGTHEPACPSYVTDPPDGGGNCDGGCVVNCPHVPVDLSGIESGLASIGVSVTGLNTSISALGVQVAGVGAKVDLINPYTTAEILSGVATIESRIDFTDAVNQQIQGILTAMNDPFFQMVSDVSTMVSDITTIVSEIEGIVPAIETSNSHLATIETYAGEIFVTVGGIEANTDLMVKLLEEIDYSTSATEANTKDIHNQLLHITFPLLDYFGDSITAMGEISTAIDTLQTDIAEMKSHTEVLPDIYNILSTFEDSLLLLEELLAIIPDFQQILSELIEVLPTITDALNEYLPEIAENTALIKDVDEKIATLNLTVTSIKTVIDTVSTNVAAIKTSTENINTNVATINTNLITGFSDLYLLIVDTNAKLNGIYEMIKGSDETLGKLLNNTALIGGHVVTIKDAVEKINTNVGYLHQNVLDLGMKFTNFTENFASFHNETTQFYKNVIEFFRDNYKFQDRVVETLDKSLNWLRYIGNTMGDLYDWFTGSYDSGTPNRDIKAQLDAEYKQYELDKDGKEMTEKEATKTGLFHKRLIDHFNLYFDDSFNADDTVRLPYLSGVSGNAYNTEYYEFHITPSKNDNSNVFARFVVHCSKLSFGITAFGGLIFYFMGVLRLIKKAFK